MPTDPAASTTAPRTPDAPGPDILPALAGDLYGYEQMLPPEDQRVLANLRSWLQREVAPIANQQWSKAEFPHHLVPDLGDLGVIGLGYDRPGRPAARRLHDGRLRGGARVRRLAGAVRASRSPASSWCRACW
jgi:alkylation response protein AidB-like acyl-CoA dehydrogenase